MKNIKVILVLSFLVAFTVSCKDKYLNDDVIHDEVSLSNDYFTTNVNVPLNVRFLENDVLPNDFVVSVSSPEMGSIKMLDEKNYFRYTPNQDVIGIDQFTYKICQGENCYEAIIEINISENTECDLKFFANEDNIFPKINKPFVTQISFFTTNDHTCLTDEVDLASFKVTSMPQNGELSYDIEKNEFVYKPYTGFKGVDVIEYEVASKTHPDVTSRAKVNIGVGESRFQTD